MNMITDAEIVLACRTLFGSNVNITRDFIHIIQPDGVKSAYRKKAKEHHPDLFAANPVHVQQKQTERFREIIRAYDILNHFFRQREAAAGRSAPQTASAPVRAPKKRDAVHASEPPSDTKDEETYYRGTVPHEVLQVGQYLYYRGRISLQTLVKSLNWQRRQRPAIGDIAARWGWLNTDEQKTISRACVRQRLFGEKAVDLGLLSVFQVNTALLYQRSHQERLGDYFVRNSILSTRDLDILVQELKEHNAGVLTCSKPVERTQAVYA
jgi:hypothetical protein